VPIESATAFRVPDVPDVQLHDLLTRFLNATGGIEHVVNDTGAAVDSASPGPPDAGQRPQVPGPRYRAGNGPAFPQVNLFRHPRRCVLVVERG